MAVQSLRKGARSQTVPVMAQEIETTDDLRQMIPPPPGLSLESSFDMGYSASGSQEPRLIKDLEDAVKRNRELQEELSSIKNRRNAMGSSEDKLTISEVLKLHGVRECGECQRHRIEEKVVFERLKAQNLIVLQDFKELYDEYVKLKKRNSEGGNVSELCNTVWLMKLEHAGKVTKVVAECKAAQDALEGQHKETVDSYKRSNEIYERALENLQNLLRDKYPDITIPVHPCVACPGQQETRRERTVQIMDNYIYPANKHLLALEEMINDLESSTNSSVRKTAECMRTLTTYIKKDKPQQVASARSTRSQIHKNIVAIETALEDLPSPSIEILSIKAKFLELPFLLKPLFELTKSYEQDIPVLVQGPTSDLHSFLCKVAEESEGQLSIDSVCSILSNYSNLLNELEGNQLKLSRYEQALGIIS